MIRLSVLLLASLLSTTAVQAADDGGFGSQRFTQQSPSALSSDEGISTFASDEINPATIEPAAGEDEPVSPSGETPNPDALTVEPDDALDRPPAD